MLLLPPRVCPKVSFFIPVLSLHTRTALLGAAEWLRPLLLLLVLVLGGLWSLLLLLLLGGLGSLLLCCQATAAAAAASLGPWPVAGFIEQHLGRWPLSQVPCLAQGWVSIPSTALLGIHIGSTRVSR